ncbi:hypothetical protein [Ciceribacter thiooxidans]|uniref:Uncharacterized protein n=1 Tax=Ciceribacter thiooxidans TaxID=1969821 RepID=A0ABV7I107_9HYPH|nr:hypothetical protein [Ciceribacter thiooxidans]
MADPKKASAPALILFRVHFAGGDKVDVNGADAADVRRRVERQSAQKIEKIKRVREND